MVRAAGVRMLLDFRWAAGCQGCRVQAVCRGALMRCRGRVGVEGAGCVQGCAREVWEKGKGRAWRWGAQAEGR